MRPKCPQGCAVLLSFCVLSAFTYITSPDANHQVILSFTRRTRLHLPSVLYRKPSSPVPSSPPTCHFWESRVVSWRNATIKTPHAVIIALPQVHGFGDRVSTIFSSFMYAMEHGMRLEIHMPALANVFQPVDALRDVVTFVEPAAREGSRCNRQMPLVMRHKRGYCELAASQPGSCGIVKYARACMRPEICNELAEMYGAEMSAVHSMGCPLSMIFQFKPEFLETNVAIFIGGAAQEMTILEARARLQKFALIALHVRTEDESFRRPTSRLQPRYKGLVKEFVSCAKGVEEKLRKTGKEVKWLVASDNEGVRAYFREAFPNKVISLLAKPQHLLKTGTSDSVVKIMAEWFMLAQADEIVLNTYQDTSRLSAFSKFAWLIARKSAIHVAHVETKAGRIYPACMRRDIHYGGNTITMPKACKTPTNSRNKELLLTGNETAE